MGHIEPFAWRDADRALWARIAAHDFEPAGVALTFTARLARDHGWSLAAAREAIAEYRRFCFLTLRADTPLTPSEEVDEVWHQHLTFSRDYWQVWCRDVLRMDLHHDPTRGGTGERRRFAEQYASTLAFYEAWFGPAPPNVWPGTADRFGSLPIYRVVDRRRAFVIPLPGARVKAWLRPVLTLGTAAALLSFWSNPAAAASFDMLDWTAGPFITVYAVAAAASLVASYWLPILLTSIFKPSSRRIPLEPVELGLLAGGRIRGADVLILQAVAADQVSLAGKVIRVGGETTTRAALARDVSNTLDAVQSRLAGQGLALSVKRERLVQVAAVALVMPVMALGIAKIAVGHARDKPVGILVFLVILTLVATLVLAWARRPASRAGRAALQAFRHENPRAIRAPRHAEIITAFACIGAAALWGTEFEAYGELLKGSGDGGGGCGGGSGCGGGGCGGCGS